MDPSEDMSWVPAETLAEGPTPEARIGHTATYDPDSKRIFVFGGSKNKKWFNDVHILDTQSWKWSTVEVRLDTHTHLIIRDWIGVRFHLCKCKNMNDLSTLFFLSRPREKYLH